MSTQSPLSPRDWELLSAYLDGELTPRERARLEVRLEREPGLRQALQRMAQTRAVLRRTPRLRAPRSFALTPAMVGQQPALPSVMRWVSLAATVLLLFVLAGDFFLAGTVKRSVAPLAMEAPLVEATAPVMEKAAAEAEEAAGAPPEAAAPAIRVPEAAPTAGTADLSATPLPTPALAPTSTPAPTLAPASAPTPGVPPWRWVEVLLAAVALISGALAWSWRR